MKKFKLIFFMPLILILILGTTSQASITNEYVEYTFTHFKNTIDLALYSYSYNAKNILNALTEQDYNAYTLQLNQLLEENNLQDLNNHNMTTFLSYDNTKNSILMYFIFSNASSPNNVNNLNYLRIKRNAPASIYISCNDNNNENIYFLELYIFNTQNSTFSQIKTLNNSALQQIPYMKSATLNSNNTILTLSNVACTNTQAVYYHIPFEVNGSNVYTQGFIRGLTTDNDPGYFKTETPQPSGDSGGSTTPSGDGGNTGTPIDLSKIENGIKDINNNLENIENKIPTSGDIKNATTSGIIDGNNQYWGNSGDLNGEKEQEEIQNIINGAMENVSGELSKNKVFKALENAEKGFFDLFKNKLEEQAYDLKFNWKKTEYEGATLLEDGEINISKMCREIPELARLQFYIRLIFNFTVIVNIIKQIYNLILATLGIDNPFLYEEGEQTTSIDTDTGEYRQYYRNKKRKLW